MREWGFGAADRERTNVHGSGISLGHPVGATGGRMLATLARELNRRERALRAGNHVHRRRAGPGRDLRAGRGAMTTALGRPHRRRGLQLRRRAVVRDDVESAWGAEVIRVDPIGGASDMHRWPVTANGTSIYWTGLNKGKRSATIDLRSPDGQELVQRLIVEGDGIVVTNAAGLSWLSYEHARGQASRPDPSAGARPSMTAPPGWTTRSTRPPDFRW